jgi:predicted esterase
MRGFGVTALAAAAAALVASATVAKDGKAPPAGAPSAVASRGEAARAAPETITLPVAGDRKVEVVLGPADSPHVIVYLHGVCGDPLAFRSWAGAAAEIATLVSLRGDDACAKGSGRFKWSWDARHIDRRIRRAIAAVDALRHARAADAAPASAEDVILVGYSQGAYRVELLASRFPDRYRRVALIAPPKQPQPSWLAKAQRVLLMAGERDIRKHLRDGRDELARLGKDVRYRELPEARHGEYGPHAPEVMGPSLRWLVGGEDGAGGPGARANKLP